MLMKRSQFVVALEFVLGLAIMLYTIEGGSTKLDVIQVAQFAIAFLVVDLFSLQLPRGDLKSMSAPVIAVAAVYLNPFEAGAGILVPGLLTALLSQGVRKVEPALEWFSRRLVVLSVGLAMALQMPLEQPLDTIWRTYAVVVAVVLADYLLGQAYSASVHAIPLLPLAFGGTGIQGLILAANFSVALLAVTIYPSMGGWGLVVVAILLLVSLQAFRMLFDVRKAHQSTIAALVRTLEARSPVKRGHSDRVARFAVEAGRHCGLSGKDLEELSYAALLHDFGEVGGETVFGSNADEGAERDSASILKGVGFLEPVLDVLRVSEGHANPESAAEALKAYLVVAASRADDLAHGEDTQRDIRVMVDLSSFLSDARMAEVERAFRQAAVQAEGAFFAVDNKV